MKMSLSWLRRYVEFDTPVEELCEKMIMSGFEVESIENLADSMNNVVVGRILSIEKHPDSDHLQICQMDVGETEPVQIITGAQNVFEGAYVPAALHDSHLPNGMHIKKGKLRGLPSNGMLCSGEELCLKESDYPGAEVNGIMILQEAYTPGTDMREVLHLDDVVIDFKITANRPDCNCVLGVARELAVALGKPYNGPAPSFKEAGGDIREHISVEVKDYDLCPRYMGRVVRNLRMKESPEWMKLCLRAAGMRPINNIVDITNYVMLETGQPMHAFDLRDVRGSKIIVRRAENGEQITTLDGKEHTLTDNMLVIADESAPSCLAGIMGSLDSEIKPDTTELFFECAKFRRDNVRRTGRTLGIRTESSGRFERGVDIINVEYAMNRALQLIDELDAGDIVSGVIDLHEELPEPAVISVAADRINALLGLAIPAETMADILNRLEIPTVLENGVLTCTVPSRRDDIEGRADLAEEVMRIYGYDHIVSTPMRGDIVRGKRLPERIQTDKAKAALIAQGVQEITTYSFISSKAIDTLRLAEEDSRRQAITLLNPLGEEYSTLRTQLITSMLTVLATNYNHKNTAVRFFEVGRLFLPKSMPITEQPEERSAMSIGLYGDKENFFTLKGLLEVLFNTFGAKVEYVRANEPFLHPGRQATAMLGDTAIATFGEVHPDTAALYDMEHRVYVAQIDLPALFKATSSRRILYKPLPRFPAVERDLALLCDVDLPVAEMERTIRSAAGRYLETVRLFDVYQGAQIEAGKKSVAFNLLFRSSEGTLSDAEIEPALQKVFKKLAEKGCILRS